MLSTTDYWVNEWLKLYFVGYPCWTIKKIIDERMGKENESRTSSKDNVLSNTFTR